MAASRGRLSKRHLLSYSSKNDTCTDSGSLLRLPFCLPTCPKHGTPRKKLRTSPPTHILDAQSIRTFTGQSFGGSGGWTYSSAGAGFGGALQLPWWSTATMAGPGRPPSAAAAGPGRQVQHQQGAGRTRLFDRGPEDQKCSIN
ncbi:uncharacterized protein LOC142765331 isoform X2 [Rhipicephalus microplus]|uniref:uncharacterized protein LOC142765331 isoform X2 n=1 Tax=Rhipicephalus microplus TaxID=6941 RepID=UPI003F6CCAB0